MPSLIRRPAKDEITGPLTAFESETASFMLRTEPRTEPMVLYVVAAALGFALLLMAVVKTDRVVTGDGKIAPTQGMLFVSPLNQSIQLQTSGFSQPADRAIVRQMNVQTGEVVKKGQVLATLDPTFVTADLTTLQQNGAATDALVARLKAERDGHTYNPTGSAPQKRAQLRLYQQRQGEYRQSVADFDARIRSDQAILTRALQDVALYQQRVAFAQRYETMETTLEARGFGSKMKTLTARDARTEVQRLLTDSQNKAEGARHDLASLQAQRQVYINHWQSDVASQLVDARNTADSAQQNLTKAGKMHDLIVLRAPEDAVVLKIADTSVGAILNAQDHEPLLTLTPLRGPVEADVMINTRDISFIRPGDPVVLKLDAYPFTRHGTAKGVIKTISDGTFTQDENGQPLPPYFKARVAITDTNLSDTPKGFRLIPGMTLTADTIVGKRTMASYLVEGGLRTRFDPMRSIDHGRME